MHRHEMTLGELAALLWSGRLYLLVGGVCGLILAAIFLWSATPYYEAVMTLAPARPMEAPIAADNETFRAHTTIRPPSENDQNFTRFQNVAEGATIAGLLLKQPSITQGLAQDKTYVFTRGEMDWHAEQLAAYMQERISFTRSSDGAITQMRYRHPDAGFAVLFLQHVHALADGLIRQDERKAVSARITYLQEELSKTFNPDHKRALTTLLLEQERLKMMVSLDQPFAADVVEKAYATFKPVWPNALFVYAGAGLMGAVFGFVIFGFRIFEAQAAAAQESTGHEGAQRAHHMRHALKNMRRWYDVEGGNNNAPRSTKKKPPEAAE